IYDVLSLLLHLSSSPTHAPYDPKAALEAAVVESHNPFSFPSDLDKFSKPSYRGTSPSVRSERSVRSGRSESLRSGRGRGGREDEGLGDREAGREEWKRILEEEPLGGSHWEGLSGRGLETASTVSESGWSRDEVRSDYFGFGGFSGGTGGNGEEGEGSDDWSDETK
ncbi:hypothetical protein HDV00_004749, partial [Rhizophlyctis rosea]